MKNYADVGRCFPPQLLALVDNNLICVILRGTGGFVVMWLCSIFGALLRKFLFQVAVLWFVVFRNFRVISKRFAVFLCYSVRCLYIILWGYLYPSYASLNS